MSILFCILSAPRKNPHASVNLNLGLHGDIAMSPLPPISPVLSLKNHAAGLQTDAGMVHPHRDLNAGTLAASFEHKLRDLLPAIVIELLTHRTAANNHRL